MNFAIYRDIPSNIWNYLLQKFEAEYHHLSLWYFVSFIFGIIYYFQDTTSFSYYRLLLVPFFLLASLYFRNKNVIVFFFLACLLSFMFGFCISYARTTLVTTKPIIAPMVGEVSGKIINIKPSLRGSQVTLINVTINDEKLSKIRINISQKLAGDLEHGNIVNLRARLFPLSTNILPDSFDFGFYMYMSGIEASGYALTSPIVVLAEKNILNEYIQNLRKKIYHRLIEVLGSNEGNFAAAILIGETKAIPVNIAKNMRDTGVAHILSVSGLHLSLVAMLFFAGSRAMLNCSNLIAYNANIKLIAAIISLIGSFAYLHISGANIAATRAFIMTSIFIMSIMAGRSLYPLRSVLVAAFVILLFLPEYVLHPSFQLSFTAVLCLISGYEFFQKNKFYLGASKGILSSIILYVFANIYSSFLASIMTAPYVIYHFYKFANYSVLMNLIAVPFMSFFMMPLAIIATILMPLRLDAYVLKLLGFFIKIVIDCAAVIVDLPGSVTSIGHISPLSLIFFTIGFFWLSLWKTNLRILGWVIILYSLYIMFSAPKPDFIYDHAAKIIALKDEHDQYELYSEEKISPFTADFWISWLGQKEANVEVIPISRRDHRLKLTNGKTISLNYNACHEADVIIVTSKKLHCNSKSSVISHDMLQNNKQILIYCPSHKACSIEFRKN